MLSVRHEPSSAALVRHELAADLARHRLDADTIDEVVLVASELVGNAIRHTPAAPPHPLDVSWEVEADGVTVRVADSSEQYPTPRLATPDAPSGRGLAIVAAMSDSWGVDPADGGKRVWAHVSVRQDRVAS
ncbi:MAG: ATP-binding protein [Jatrophihabitantaceae bacterium]